MKVNKQIVDILADLPDLSVLQQFSGGDVALSLVALEKLIPAVKELLKNAAPPPPPEPDKDQPEQPEPSDGDKGEPGSSEGESGEPGRPEGEPGEPGEGQEADEGEPNGDDDDSWDDEPASIDPAQAEAILAKGMEDAKEAAEQIRTQELSFGSEAGEWAADADPATRLATLDRMKHMKRLLDLVGRMTRFAMGEYANRITPSEHEMYGVRMGNQMQRILPHQFALLGHPATKVEFFRRYSGGELLEWKMRGKQRAGKGPVVILVDRSDSMSWGQDRMSWAVAVAESMRRIAAKQGRDVYVQFFNSALSNAFHFPKGKADLPDILDMLSVQANGGTSFTQPCDKAMQVISAAKDFEKADIVLITDGAAKADAGWVERFLASKQQHGVRVFSVFIGTGAEAATWASPSSTLGAISDHLLPVQDLTIDAVHTMYREF